MIGFTGAFGSGCTVAAKHLRDRRDFKFIGLSKSIRDEWEEEREPTRAAELQFLGDDLRKAHGRGILVNKAVDAFDSVPELLVVDGIRNRSEVDVLLESRELV